jgi:hypothetical protein
VPLPSNRTDIVKFDLTKERLDTARPLHLYNFRVSPRFMNFTPQFFPTRPEIAFQLCFEHAAATILKGVDRGPVTMRSNSQAAYCLYLFLVFLYS